MASPAAFASPSALTPAALHSAYSLPNAARNRQTVAVVVAFNDPTIAQDLAIFSRAFSLPKCTRANGCLRVVNESGASTPLPAPDPTGGEWTTEEALSTETIHGICQNCRLRIVEAEADGRQNLANAVDTAVRLGAREIATSYIFTEGLFDSEWAPDYNHPGVVITAAAGDAGFADSTNVPAAYQGVVAVGGTDLRVRSGGRRISETVWKNADGTGASGCSLFTAAPAWQVPYASKAGCGSMRAVADVSAAAAPGAPVFSNTPVDYRGDRGWFEAGGTSLASPLVAAVFALAGGIGRGQSAAAMLYARSGTDHRAFHDITRGSNGSCGGKPICRAGPGYDGPTGVGAPNGIAGF